MANENKSKHEHDNPYGYRGFTNRHSLMQASGTALIILGCALASFASLLPSIDNADSTVIAKAIDEIVRLASKDLVQTNFAGTHALATVLLIAFIIVGSWILNHARNDLKEFQEAYPLLAVSFTEQERRTYKTLSRRFIVAGTIILAATITIGLSIHGFTNLYANLEGTSQINSKQAIATGSILAFVALGCWVLIRGTTLRNIPNMALYNYKALDKHNVYEMDRDSTGKLNSGLMHARKIVARKSLVNRVFIIIGIIVALAFYALPSLETPYFWIALLAALIACKISSHKAYKSVLAIFNELTP